MAWLRFAGFLLALALAAPASAYQEIILNAASAIPQRTDGVDGRHVVFSGASHTYRALEFGNDALQDCVDWLFTLPPDYPANGEMDFSVSYTEQGPNAVTYGNWSVTIACVGDGENYHSATFPPLGQSFALGSTGQTIGRLYISTGAADVYLNETGCAAGKSAIFRLCNNGNTATTKLHILNLTIRYPCPGNSPCQ